MRLLASLIRLVATLSQAISQIFNRISRLLNGLLPALLSPCQLNALTREFYADHYTKESIKEALRPGDNGLVQWELEISNRYHLDSGRMLVLASGQGRESIAISRRGVTVIGLDTDEHAVRTARRSAGSVGVPAQFVRASFLELPFASTSFDFVLLSDVMYSAIPDLSARQAWLADLRRLLRPNGLAILSFEVEQQPTSRLTPICARLNEVLVKFPGANKTYRRGDAYVYGHFIHCFQDENEIRNELLGAGITIQELNWAHQFAVVKHSPSISPSS